MKFSVLLFLLVPGLNSFAQNWKDLTPPETGEKWVQPSAIEPAQSVWGHKNGIRVGLFPMGGPRGLIRIYAPYLGIKDGEPFNYFALEPIAKGDTVRGFSELEMSGWDDKRGKIFWSANDSIQIKPVSTLAPVRGVIEKVAGVETLSLFVFCEPFQNGANVFVRLRFFEDSPYDVEITPYTNKQSVALDKFIITATMGNFARLRKIYLKSGVVSSHSLWPDYSGDWFTKHESFSSSDFVKDSTGYRYFIATPDEEDPNKAVYAEGTANHWKYKGAKAVQYWKIMDDSKLPVNGLVNGRFTYWASKSPIPGGISFENFELNMPFENGYSYRFGVTPFETEGFLRDVVNSDRK